MDDETKFGKTLFYRGFSWAVEKNLLSDYKVIVLAVDEGLVSSSIQNRLATSDELNLDDASKIVGCYKALTKQNLIGETRENPSPMKRALAFCKNITVSERITREFTEVVDEFVAAEHNDDGTRPMLSVETRHVDGTFNAKEREDCLDWLKSETDADICRILTNARCLSEGVDVPALDAIIFMHPRNSQIDVIQSVGRVMRKTSNKNMGYVILPVAISSGVKPEDALSDIERYKVVWQILNALRAHDDRFDAMINQADLGEDISDKIEIVGITSAELEATTAVVDDIDINKTRSKPKTDNGGGAGDDGDDVINGRDDGTQPPEQIAMVFDELTQAIRAKIVEKCGTREYWDTWARDIARIAETHITRITTITEVEGSSERAAFVTFLAEIRDDLNPEISESDAIEMLAQHLITRPVFDTLYKDNEFTRNNPVSKAMEIVLGQLDQHKLKKEAESLKKFYQSVKRRAKGIKTVQGRQTLVVELYDKFFRTAFPAMTQRLGIVYTPIEVVDFIIHSVNDVLISEFGQTLGSKGVHILDPFTGTGTFITRLLQSGLITPEELEYKFKNEIHANEIVLLAYYIAAINIEAVYHDMEGPEKPYSPFDGIVLTDTFQLYEQQGDLIADLLPDNSERRTRQKELDIRVIIGNPPYSAGQRNENDNAMNIAYPSLDEKIRSTYAASSKGKGGKRALYDSYIRAIRWASDRLGEGGGVLAFVSGSAWIERGFADGMRKCLAEEFSDLYLVHLRGDIRKQMLSNGTAGEGENVFGQGSMTGVTISILVKNPERFSAKNINFINVGDDLSKAEKFSALCKLSSVGKATDEGAWKRIKPNVDFDWLDQRDQTFEKHLLLADKSKSGQDTIFQRTSYGVVTNRDSWCYNASPTALAKNVNRLIDFYNSEVERFDREFVASKHKNVDDFVDPDPTKISWGVNMKSGVKKGILRDFQENKLVLSAYRPFCRRWLYSDRNFVHSLYSTPFFFPNSEAANLVIQVSGVGARAGFSALMTDQVPSLDTIEKGQCFSLYLYKEAQPDDDLLGSPESQTDGFIRRDAITDKGLASFQAAYPGQEISKKDLFYYIYGLLHSFDYRDRFKNNLAKEMPRIPAVKSFIDFSAFRDAGRALGDLHVNFESVEPYMVTFEEGDHDLINEAQSDPKAFYRVEKMKFGGKGKNKDKTTVLYNPRITMNNIPLRAYDYVVNGKSALDWVMERQCVKTDKASGIVNDANRYAIETVNDPRYPLDLFRQVITVSLKTLDIIDNIPKLDID